MCYIVIVASITPISIDPAANNIDLEIGAMVEIVGGASNCRYGVVKWLGRLRDNIKIYAGVQMVCQVCSIICVDNY